MLTLVPVNKTHYQPKRSFIANNFLTEAIHLVLIYAIIMRQVKKGGKKKKKSLSHCGVNITICI